MPNLMLFVNDELTLRHRLVQATHGACLAGTHFPGAAKCAFVILRFSKDMYEPLLGFLYKSGLKHGVFRDWSRPQWGPTCVYVEPVEEKPDWLKYFELL